MAFKKHCVMFGKAGVLLSGALAVGLGAAVSSAATVSIYNTGTNDSGNVLASGAAVPNYTLVSAPNGQATTLAVYSSSGGYPGSAWLAPNTTSAWIAPASDGAYSNSPQTFGLPGNYDYQTTFTSAVAGVITITGQWATDNSGTGIVIDGVAAPMTPAELPGYTGFQSFTSFNITGNVVAGSNTLDFLVSNGATSTRTDSANPVGLRVEISRANVAAAPVPGTGALALIGGLAMVGGLALRRRVCG